MMRERRRKLINICLLLLVLLIAQEAILFTFAKKESIFARLQKKLTYSASIEQGMKFYTAQNIEKLKIDEYFLLKEINRWENKINFAELPEKYTQDPFKRIINKKNYISDLNFNRSSLGEYTQHPSNGPLYELNNSYQMFLKEPWDDVILKALYCDVDGYDDTDFSVLKSVKTNDGGYWDTHVLLGLMFLQENKCYEPEKVNEQIGLVVDKIIAAEQNDQVFSDLYAERIVFLYWAGYGNAVKKAWADMVKDNLADDPGWRRERKFSSNAHTTGLALLSLIYYREGESRQLFYR